MSEFHIYPRVGGGEEEPGDFGVIIDSSFLKVHMSEYDAHKKIENPTFWREPKHILK